MPNLSWTKQTDEAETEATPGGFEPPVSTVTGWHVRPLHHGASSIKHGLSSQPTYKVYQGLPSVSSNTMESYCC